MVKLRRRGEEVFHQHKELLSPILYRKTFVISAQGEILEPVRMHEIIVDDQDLQNERLIWREDWEVPDDAYAFEIICSTYGNFFRPVYTPPRVSLAQIPVVEDLLSEFGLSLAERDEYEHAVLLSRLRKYLSGAEMSA